MVDQAKLDLRQERQVKAKERYAAERAKSRREFLCFWTRPFGHEYKWSNAAQKTLCVGCDRPWS